jgi:sigma-B regulation protein RsbU (phosphoserine phosphatase)
MPPGQFASAVFGWFDSVAGRLLYASAGHPPSYLRSPGHPLRELEGTGPLLGVLPEAEYSSLAVEILPGSQLFVYTDGLTEANDPQGRLWGTGELAVMLESSEPEHPNRVLNRILERLAQFRGERPQEDDVTAMLTVFVPVPSTPD